MPSRSNRMPFLIAVKEATLLRLSVRHHSARYQTGLIERRLLQSHRIIDAIIVVFLVIVAVGANRAASSWWRRLSTVAAYESRADRALALHLSVVGAGAGFASVAFRRPAAAGFPVLTIFIQTILFDDVGPIRFFLFFDQRRIWESSEAAVAHRESAARDAAAGIAGQLNRRAATLQRVIHLVGETLSIYALGFESGKGL